MFSRRKSGEGKRKVTPPSPTYMSSEQFSTYLADLRSARVSRPGGSREMTSTSNQGKGNASTTLAADSKPQPRMQAATRPVQGTHIRQAQSLSSAGPLGPSVAQRSQGCASSTARSRYSTGPSARDYYPAQQVAPLAPSEVVPSSTYMERGQRWMEKEEAYSLRHALHEMDLTERGKTREGEDMDDQKLYQDALKEAAELVWQYEHGGLPVAQPTGPYQYRPHLRKQSYAHARTASVGRYGDDIQVSGLARNCSRSVSGSSIESDPLATRESLMSDRVHVGRQAAKPYMGISGQAAASSASRKSSVKRNISGEIEATFSGDQIWEEPETSSMTSTGRTHDETTTLSALERKDRNPLGRVRFSTTQDGSGAPGAKPMSTTEIHRNPPSRSRDPRYTTNTATAAGSTRRVSDEVGGKHKNTMEVRSSDIRQATSMKLADRSEKLPTPSAVSDHPGRPIVSFDANWMPAEEAKAGAGCGRSRQQATPGPTSSIPTISVDHVEPSAGPAPPDISVDECSQGTSIPIIVTPNDEGCEGPGQVNSRPLPRPSAASTGTSRRVRPRAPYRPSAPVAQEAATCHECGSVIRGRFVALSGSPEKFHPSCFCCYACGTGLEALEISPEPDSFRSRRLDRIKTRAAGEILHEKAGETMAEDGDDRLRFYCHLDWHELFAPHCKHCKTPIVGEHMVALGEHWHYGHFFCAECGDPFEHGMTHIEKDGYAWCVNCQTKRTERRAPKCTKCKLAVVGQYIQALGGEWHEDCFRCASCLRAFDDGQIFPRDGENGTTLVLCTACRSRELKQ